MTGAPELESVGCTVRYMYECMANGSMLNFWYRNNGHFIPRSKELLSRLVSLDNQLAMDAQRFFTAPPDERWFLAEKIADRTIGVHGFFEWESEPEVMAE